MTNHSMTHLLATWYKVHRVKTGDTKRNTTKSTMTISQIIPKKTARRSMSRPNNGKTKTNKPLHSTCFILSTAHSQKYTSKILKSKTS